MAFWKMHHLSVIFPLKPPFIEIFQQAMFDETRGCNPIKSIGFPPLNHQLPMVFLWVSYGFLRSHFLSCYHWIRFVKVLPAGAEGMSGMSGLQTCVRIAPQKIMGKLMGKWETFIENKTGKHMDKV